MEMIKNGESFQQPQVCLGGSRRNPAVRSYEKNSLKRRPTQNVRHSDLVIASSQISVQSNIDGLPLKFWQRVG